MTDVISGRWSTVRNMMERAEQGARDAETGSLLEFLLFLEWCVIAGLLGCVPVGVALTAGGPAAGLTLVLLLLAIGLLYVDVHCFGRRTWALFFRAGLAFSFLMGIAPMLGESVLLLPALHQSAVALLCVAALRR